jgi:hypothetical protein
MLNVRIIGGVAQAQRRLTVLEQKLHQQVLVRSLNKVAFETRDELKRIMIQVFDRPRPFTLNALYFKLARPGSLVAEVGIKDFAGKGTPAAKYLLPQIQGGPRAHKRVEKALIYAGIMARNQFAIPSWQAPKDAHGNVRTNVYTQMLSSLGASLDPMQNRTARSRARAATKRKPEYFVVTRADGKAIGIARASGTAGKRGPLNMLFFFGRQPTYRQRFDFRGIARRVALAQWPVKLRQELARALAGDGPYAAARRGA